MSYDLELHVQAHLYPGYVRGDVDEACSEGCACDWCDPHMAGLLDAFEDAGCDPHTFEAHVLPMQGDASLSGPAEERDPSVTGAESLERQVTAGARRYTAPAPNDTPDAARTAAETGCGGRTPHSSPQVVPASTHDKEVTC